MSMVYAVQAPTVVGLVTANDPRTRRRVLQCDQAELP
jgi:hypothetical protein